MAKTKTRIRRTFTSEYKLQAVQLVTDKGFSYAEAARQLGLRDTQIRTWKKQFDAEGAKAFPGQPNPLLTIQNGCSGSTANTNAPGRAMSRPLIPRFVASSKASCCGTVQWPNRWRRRTTLPVMRWWSVSLEAGTSRMVTVSRIN